MTNEKKLQLRGGLVGVLLGLAVGGLATAYAATDYYQTAVDQAQLEAAVYKFTSNANAETTRECQDSTRKLLEWAKDQ